MKVQTKKMLVFGIGGALIVIGCVIGGCWQLIFDKILQNSVALTPTSMSYELWKDTPIPMYLDLYLWNWKNPQEVLNPNNRVPVKPIFVQHGPYVFSEVHNKVNITWNDNTTVTFMQKRIWAFVPEQSNGSLDDQITNVNVIPATVANAVRHQSKLVQIVLSYILKDLQETIYITKSAREWLFDGYEDKLLDLASKLNLTVKLPFTKFGWFVDRNGNPDYDGIFNMFTGTDDIGKLGELHAWKYNTKTNFYQENCNEVYGGLGEIGPPLTGISEIKVFTPDFCTAFPLSLNGELDKLGVVGNKYIGTIAPFDNGFSIPAKLCYCTVEDGKEKCELPGVINVGKCKFGAPVYVSYAHFYLSDPYYRNEIEGMHPQKEKHEFYMAIEPVSGIPLEVRGSLQINLKLEAFPGIAMYQNVRTAFIPTIWFTQRADLTEDKVGLVKLLLLVPPIGFGTFFGIAGIGVLMVVIGLVLTVRKGWKGDEGDKLVSS